MVPPMSSEMRLASLTTRPMAAAPSTPATGPDSTMAIGASRAAANVAVPPEDCITYRAPPTPMRASSRSSRSRYRAAIGLT